MKFGFDLYQPEEPPFLSHSALFFFPACFADEELPLDADGAEILSETFKILSLKEIKLQVMSGSTGGAGEEEPEENIATMTKAVMQAAQKKVVSQVSASDHVFFYKLVFVLYLNSNYWLWNASQNPWFGFVAVLGDICLLIIHFLCFMFSNHLKNTINQ